MKKENGRVINTVINPGFNEILGTDEKANGAPKGKAYLDYRRKWNENPKAGIVEDFPLHIDIESTNACNLRCTMCMRNFMKEVVGYMDWDLFKKIIDEGSKHNLPSIKLNYRGEPLIHPRIVDMVRYAKDKGIMDVQFNTNAMLLDRDKSRALIEAGLDRIIFSVDGATKETYEKIRTGAKYETVINNIKTFVETRDNMGRETPAIRVQMVETKENSHEVDDFIAFWKPIANRVAINRMRNPDGCETGQEFSEVFACPQIWQRIIVCWDGEVRMCCGDWKGMYIIGDAKKYSIRGMWHGDKYNAVREAHKSGDYDKFKVCAKCEVNKR